MTSAELKVAMLAGVPVIHRDRRHMTTIRYDRITEIVTKPNGRGGLLVSVKLEDKSGNSSVMADVREVEKA